MNNFEHSKRLYTSKTLLITMVFVKGKTLKQYNRDNYEKNKDSIKKARKDRYKFEKANRKTIIHVDNLTIKARKVVIVDDR